MTYSLTPRMLLASVASVVALVALRSLSSIPLGGAPGDHALLRLSWSARPERVERCRRLSDEELAKRPVHMQLRWECEGHFARYLFTMRVDDELMAEDTLRGGGFRNDRPLHRFEEHRVAPGTHRLLVQIVRIDSSGASGIDDEDEDDAPTDSATAFRGERDAREKAERRRREDEALPQTLVLDTTVTITPRSVVLITYENEARRLVARSEP